MKPTSVFVVHGDEWFCPANLARLSEDEWRTAERHRFRIHGVAGEPWLPPTVVFAAADWREADKRQQFEIDVWRALGELGGVKPQA